MATNIRLNGQYYTIGVWYCSYDGARLCTCCQPKNVLPASILRNPVARDFARVIENGKSRAYIFSPRKRGTSEGSYKSRRKS